MAYQSRHSGAQIDAAIDAINAALQREQMWVNKEVAVTASSWQPTYGGEKGAYVYTMEYTAFSEINKFPSVYFIDTEGQIWSVEVQYNSTTNPTSISVYSNRGIKGTIVICSGSGHTTNTNE